MGEDYYALLSIEVNATAAQIKKAYRDKAKFWHPDKNTGKSVKSFISNNYFKSAKRSPDLYQNQKGLRLPGE